jgi:hypothetical protein
VRQTIVPNVETVQKLALAQDLPFADRIRTLLPRLAQIIAATPLGAVVKMVVGESRNFPELAKVWHDEVALKGIGLLSSLIEAAQAKGEIRAGDPRIHAFSLMGPLLVGIIWRETFTPVGGAPIDLPAIAGQHVETALDGLLVREIQP